MMMTCCSYHRHLNPAQLKNELALLSQCNIAANIAWFNDVELRRDTHRPVYAAVATLIMIPSTTASCERTFSDLRRLKTYLRSTMSQERLNSLIVASVHVALLDGISVVCLWRASLLDLMMRVEKCTDVLLRQNNSLLCIVII